MMWVAMACGLAGGVVLALRWAHRRLVLVTVRGSSMSPTYEDGDRVLVHRRRTDAIRVGEPVVVRPPRAISTIGWNIKRVAALAGDPVPVAVAPAVGGVTRVPPGALVVTGDGMSSMDSRTVGFYRMDGVLGVVVCALARSPRAG
jgi:signal peptidase I